MPRGQGLDIDYRVGRVEDLEAEGLTFDAVVCLEVVEHVPDAGAFLKTCAALVRPGGLMLLSTINRTLKAYLLAIVGAEYVLRWLPVGTHQWERFVTPDELARHLRAAGLERAGGQGAGLQPAGRRLVARRRHRRELPGLRRQAWIGERSLYRTASLFSRSLLNSDL